MKSSVLALVLCSTLALIRVAPASAEGKAEKALKECNATIPVQKNPRIVVAEGIAAAKLLKLSQEEKCFLLCYLQKVGFLDENANIANGKEVIRYSLKKKPDIAKYSNVVIASLFQISRSTRGLEDKCLKAFIVYHQFAMNVFALEIADGLDTSIGVKEKLVNYIQTGQPVEKELENDVKSFLGFFDLLLTTLAEDVAKASV